MLDDHETQPDPLTVHFRGALQLTKASEKFDEVFLFDSYTRVLNVNHELVLWLDLVASPYLYFAATLRKFESVLDEIEQNLHEAPLVTVQFGDHVG